ncbi:hypothetical protein GALMADRAFT_208346 [Galerina marginata CBS 339.88]|uniref:Uncharacterized protein n=1 Tax=Galerina marginata (strain CBS 339.88) TaxID=685588 RepID=A0A067TJS1_GALM3|nr:hypothetical protein GALMADRAFT_208346 [Galerina marginata CBS 339.88]
MAPQRVPDAATVSPYPFVVRQERQPPPPPDNADRGPHAKGKKPRARPRAERNPRQEEEPRFNTGPRNLRAPQANRGGRRGFRMPGRTYPEDQNVPDYPPPSFQEAMTSPPVSVCSSTTSLALAPTVPLAIPEIIPEHPQESDEVEPARIARNPLNETTASETGSDTDDSIFIIDKNSVPVCSDDLPRGPALEERIKTDWLRRRGVEFPGKSTGESSKLNDGAGQNINRGRTATKPPMLVNIDPDDKAWPPSPVSSPKRRFMSLSPLRTIFPRSPAPQDRATLSAHPSPSPSLYPSSRSIFFRSSSSLSTASFLGLPLLSSTTNLKGDTLSRKIFKGKERAKTPADNIDVWEVVEEENYAGVDKDGNERSDQSSEHPRSLMSAVESLQRPLSDGASPTRSQSFTFGSHIANSLRSRQRITPNEVKQFDERHHSLSLLTPRVSQELTARDWKGPSTAFIDRPINRGRSPVSSASGANTTTPVSPSASSVELAPIPEGPPLTMVRVRAMSPPPQPAQRHTTRVVHPSPLRVDARPNVIVDEHAVEAAAMYQRALDTPLPMTPVFNHFNFGGSVSILSLDEPPLAPISGRNGPNLLTDSISAPSRPPFATKMSPPLTVSLHPSATSSTSPSVVNTSSQEEPMTPTRHHYTGRPLPRPPPTTASRVNVVDSIYASPGDSGTGKNDTSYSSCPEGLLIDLDDTTLDDIPGSGASTPSSDDGFWQSRPHLPMSQASSSSVDLVGPPTALTFDSMQATSTPLLPMSPSRGHPPGQGIVLSELTDLDLLVSRLDSEEPNGYDYEVSSGPKGWKEPGLNKPSDTASGLRVNWTREPPTARAALPNRHPPETQSQRKYVAHWAY